MARRSQEPQGHRAVNTDPPVLHFEQLAHSRFAAAATQGTQPPGKWRLRTRPSHLMLDSSLPCHRAIVPSSPVGAARRCAVLEGVERRHSPARQTFDQRARRPLRFPDCTESLVALRVSVRPRSHVTCDEWTRGPDGWACGPRGLGGD